MLRHGSKLSLRFAAISALCVLAGCSSQPNQEMQPTAVQPATPQCVAGKPATLVNLERLAQADAAEAWARESKEAGLGFSVRRTESAFVVEEASDFALAQGIREGDVLLCIAPAEGEQFFDAVQFELDDVVTLLRGVPGSNAGVRLRRERVAQDLWLVRAQ